jgi:hypothetical protein
MLRVQRPLFAVYPRVRFNACADACPNAGTDVGPDSGPDTGPDAGPDAGLDDTGALAEHIDK